MDNRVRRRRIGALGNAVLEAAQSGYRRIGGRRSGTKRTRWRPVCYGSGKPLNDLTVCSSGFDEMRSIPSVASSVQALVRSR